MGEVWCACVRACVYDTGRRPFLTSTRMCTFSPLPGVPSRYCHCPPLPLTCKSNVDCVTPWYNSYCQAKPNATGVCHSELPPKCVKDTDCARKPNASDTTVFDAVSTTTALPSTPSAVAAGNFTQYYCNGTKPLDDCTNDLGKVRLGERGGRDRARVRVCRERVSQTFTMKNLTPNRTKTPPFSSAVPRLHPCPGLVPADEPRQVVGHGDMSRPREHQVQHLCRLAQLHRPRGGLNPDPRRL